MNPSVILVHPRYPELKRFIIEHTGLAYYAERDEDLAGRIGRRMAAAGCDDCGRYLDRLRLEDKLELDALVGELTVGETFFFRQAEHFETLRTMVFPEMFERNRSSRQIRIWSAGCATGAEAYSVAIVLKRHFQAAMDGWNVSILGTDINRDFVARAQAARFDPWAFRQAPHDLREQCFSPEGKRWLLLPEYRNLVTFGYHNLIQDPFPPGLFDLILCRNVTIYFNAGATRRVARGFYESLAPGGWLVVGHAEPSATVFQDFETIILSGVTYYQKPAKSAPDASAAAEAPRRLPARPPQGVPAKPVPPAPTVADVRALADRGDWEAAAGQAERLLSADTLNAAAHFTQALILAHTRPAVEAEAALRKAIYLDRGFALAHYHLGLCLAQAGRAAQARKAFANVVDLLAEEPDDETLEHGDGITAGELLELASMHLEESKAS
jgi:chemotaxis protein methyltransferase CheR